MALVVDVAHHILEKLGSMSSMKLQKLVYYSQAWSMVFTGEPMYKSDIEAWANGPVVRDLYYLHRGRYTVGPNDFQPMHSLSLSDTLTIDAVLKAYGHLDAHELSELTHQEKPWLDAREGVADGVRSDKAIDLATMHEYYEALLSSQSQ